MFVIKPIQSKEEQKDCCLRCAIPYIKEDLAYQAVSDGQFSAIAQFRIESGVGIIDHIVSLPGTNEWEMMFIMGRQTLNYIDLCGTHVCRAASDAGEEKLLLSIGFKKADDGSYFIDLHGLFDGCAHSHPTL